MQIHLLTTQKHAHEMSWFCFSLPQPAFYLAGPQCTVHDSLPAQGLHQGDEWSWAAPAVLLPGEGTRILRRWAPVSFSQAGPQTTQKSQLEKILLKKKKGALLESVAMLKISWVFALECTLRKTSRYLLGNLQHSLRFWFPSEFLEVSNRGYGLVLDVSYNNCQMYKTSFHT